MSNECPDDFRLRSLLNTDRSNGTEDDTIQSHVENCVSCQSRLDQLCDQPLVNEWIGVLQSDDRRDEDTVDRTHRAEGTLGDAQWQQSAAPRSLPELDRYTVHREIGRGGMGVVYEATHADLGRRVALKMLISGSLAGPERLSRFHREAQAIAKIEHPNIVQIYDVAEHAGVPYFALEYIENGSLDDKLDGVPWNPDSAAQLIRAVAEGVQAAHDHGFIHRDLKPANILVAETTATRSGWLPKITDFGLAKRDIDATLTRSGVAIGTPRYLSPEQAIGDESSIQFHSDVYAIGCVLYELLTGRAPFQAETIAETIRQISENDPVEVRRLNSAVPRDLATICHKCLRKHPATRYATAKALAEDLHRFENQQPILARPISPFETSIKWARRNPAVASLLTLVGVALIAIILLWADFTKKLTDKTEFAQDKAKEALKREEDAIDAADARSEILAFFTQDLFKAATPGQSGRDVRVFDVLMAADKKIEDQFVSRPRLRAAVRLGIAESLQALGEHREALAQAEAATEIILEEDGSDSEQAIEARLLLAELYSALSETDRAIAVIAELKTADVNEERRMEVEATLAGAFCAAGRFNEAREVFFDLYQEALAVYGEDHQNTLNLLSDYAVATHESGDLEAAQELLEKYRLALVEKLGKNHIESIQATRNLAVSYAMTGKIERALEMQNESYQACLVLYGPTHPETTTGLHNYAMALSRNKKYEEARPLLEDAVANAIDHFGPNHATCINFLGNLAYMHFEFGHADRAAACLEEFCDPIREDAFDHPNWGVLLLTYGRVRQRLGQYPEAMSLFEQAKGIFDRSTGTTPLMTKTLAKSMKKLSEKMRETAE